MSLTVEPDYKVAVLIDGYLKTAASIAAGVPAEAALARTLMHHGGKVAYPSLCIVATEDKGSSEVHRIIRVNPVLQTLRQASGEDVAQGATMTTREEASVILRAINKRLQDIDALGAYLAALDEADRTGWVLLDTPRVGGDLVPMSRAKGANDPDLWDYALTMTWHLAVPPA